MATIDDYGNPTDPANSPSVSAWAAAVRAELVALRGDVDAAPQVVFDTDPPTGTPAQAGIVWVVVPSGTTATALYMSTATDWIEIPIGGGAPTPTGPETLFDPASTAWNDLTGANALGNTFLCLYSCTLTKVRIYPRHTSDVPCRIYTAAGTLLTSQTLTGLTADTWQEFTLTSPQALTAGQSYMIAMDTGTPTRQNTYAAAPKQSGNELVSVTAGYYASPGNFPNNGLGNLYAIDGVFEVV